MKAMSTLLALAFLVAPALAAGSDTGFEFNHEMHVEDVGLECADCHGVVGESTSLLERFLPGKPQCGDCHDLGDVKACGTCHTNADAPSGYAVGTATVDLFNHAAHSGTMECAQCHGGAPEYSADPVKSDCRACHTTVANFQDCSLCHSTGRENIPENHDGLWEHWHGVTAGSDPVSCENCHAQDDCQQCHAGDNLRPRTHPLNFEFNHGIRASSNDVECGTCHMDPSFCSECHAANLIIPQTHADPGWRSGVVHGPEALFEIEACISCHDAGEAVPATCGGSGCHQGG